MNKKYLIWNNKGGVGKTFLSYNLSVEYAKANPDKDIVVIDACPQTNISEIILGGNGKGSENVNSFNSQNLTIAGYIKKRVSTSRHERIGTEIGYFIEAHKYNENMPKNLYLLCGDMDLDICSALINYMASFPAREAWKHSRLLINDLIESFEQLRQHTNRELCFFIDCNPSFSNYTENAILASNRIIIPCMADAASIRGIKNLFKLIYNISIDQKRYDDDYITFHNETEQSGLILPKVHLFIQNRSRSLSRTATTAFRSHAEEITRIVTNISSTHNDLLTGENIEDRVINIKDGNTLASILNHEGCALSDLRNQKYEIYGQQTQANEQQINSLKEDIEKLLQLI